MPRLPTHLYNQWFHSTSPTSKSKGTTIAIHKTCPFQLVGRKIDSQGRYVFLKDTLAEQVYTFATIYAPNTNQLTFIDATLDPLAEVEEGFVVLGEGLQCQPRSSIGHI